jgi:hypothetical protein
MTAPQILGSKAMSIQNLLCGFHYHMEGKECVFIPSSLVSIVVHLCESSWL